MKTSSLIAVWVLIGTGVQAKIDLVTTPPREEVRIALDARNVALVQETRVVTLDAGKNHLEFAWPNVNIALDAVYVEPTRETEGFVLLSTAIPPKSPNVLVLEALSENAGELPLRVTYLPQGITWVARHTVQVNADETFLSWEAGLLVINDTGEDYTDALVEAPVGEPFRLSLRSHERKEIPLARFEKVPIEKFYRVETPFSKPNVVATQYRVLFEKSPKLLPGRVRLFQADAKGNIALIGEEVLPDISPGEEVLLHPGTSQDVEVEGKVLSRIRTDEKRNRQGIVVLYNTVEESEIVVRNRKPIPTTVVLHVQTEGDWDMLSNSDPFEKKDATSFEFRVKVEPYSEKKVTFKLRGNNRQNGFVLPY